MKNRIKEQPCDIMESIFYPRNDREGCDRIKSIPTFKGEKIDNKSEKLRQSENLQV